MTKTTPLKRLSSPFVTSTYIIAFLLIYSSCTPVKQLKYFQDLPDTSHISLPSMQPDERVIQIKDRLQITFGAVDDEAATIFNKYGGVLTSGTDLISTAGTQQTELSGFLVDAEGTLDFPVLGKIRAVGLTAIQLKDTLTRKVAPYLKNPLVNVRFISFRVTVLGEVRAPGVYNLPIQNTTILDALGVSGDLPPSAKRSDITFTGITMANVLFKKLISGNRRCWQTENLSF